MRRLEPIIAHSGIPPSVIIMPVDIVSKAVNHNYHFPGPAITYGSGTFTAEFKCNEPSVQVPLSIFSIPSGNWGMMRSQRGTPVIFVPAMPR